MRPPVQKVFSGRSELSPARLLVLSFLGLILCGTAALMAPACAAPGRQTELVDALFTATSAICVTGLSSVDTELHFSRLGQVVILVLLQMGGLGIILFSSSLLLMFGGRLGLRGRMIVQEHLPGLSLSGAGRLTRHVLAFVFCCELAGAILLYLAFASRFTPTEALYHALFHAVSAFCNAGFSTWSTNLADWRDDPLVNLTVMGLIVMGGIGYLVSSEMHGRILERDWGARLSLHTRIVLWATAFLILGGAAGIAFFEQGNPRTFGGLGPLGQVLAALFQSVTCRTAGFNTVDIGALREETRHLMMILMFIGGAPGSTAGGIKVTTFSILVLATWAQFRGRPEVEVGGRRIPGRRVLQALSLAMVALATVATVTILLNYLEEIAYGQLLFEAVSALGTVGLTTGITFQLSPGSKVVLCLAMFIGRVGPLTLFASLVARARGGVTRRPEGEVIIG